MGYLLSDLGKLQVDAQVSLYIFVINGGWRGGSYQLLMDNFSKLAREIGPNAVIATGLDGAAWTKQVAEKYLGRIGGEDALEALLPALLITDAHPDEIVPDGLQRQIVPDYLRLVIPLQTIEQRSDRFFGALTDFATNGDMGFLQRFFRNADNIGINDVISLAPNYYGIGINLNKALERYRNRGGVGKYRV